jgi:pyrroloquinoline-quinone synthase
MIHYNLHAKIDKAHAQDFFEIVEDKFDDDERHYFIEQGLELGAYVFDRLYRDMALACARPTQHEALHVSQAF